MSSSLVLPVHPDNLRGRWGEMVESDVFDICRRVREIDPNLVIYVMDKDSRKRFSVVEMCRDGVERFVFHTDALDARIIEKLQYLLRVPFEKRYAEAEKLEAKAQEEDKQRQLDELYDRVGAPMWGDLERCGFIQRPVSYAKRGVRPRAA